jgi:hypothetical protein
MGNEYGAHFGAPPCFRAIARSGSGSLRRLSSRVQLRTPSDSRGFKPGAARPAQSAPKQRPGRAPRPCVHWKRVSSIQLGWGEPQVARREKNGVGSAGYAGAG